MPDSRDWPVYLFSTNEYSRPTDILSDWVDLNVHT